jgi:hypothetical protein
MAGHGSGGPSSRPVNCEWAALRVATGLGLGNNRGGTTATHAVVWPRVIPSAAPGLEEPAAAKSEPGALPGSPPSWQGELAFSPHPITFVI